MAPLTLLIVTVAVSLLVSTAILAAIIRPLRRVIGMLCTSGESTPFWVAFTMVMLYIAPLFLAVTWSPVFDSSFVQVARVTLIAALFGSFVGMVIVGYKIAGSRAA